MAKVIQLWMAATAAVIPLEEAAAAGVYEGAGNEGLSLRPGHIHPLVCTHGQGQAPNVLKCFIARLESVPYHILKKWVWQRRRGGLR